MNDKRKIEINIVEVQTYKILIQINSIIPARSTIKKSKHLPIKQEIQIRLPAS